MFRTPLAGFDRRKLRLWLSLFFIALIVPTGLLIYQAYSQLKWEAFHQHRLLAEELSERINSRLHELVADEEKRSFSDYSFLLISGDAAANYLQRSPLAAFPVATDVPGLIGYFQVDTDGLFSTPLLPLDTDSAARYGISRIELGQRAEVANNLQVILSQNQLVEMDEVDPTFQAGDKFLAASRERLDRDGTMGRAEAPTLEADLDYAFNSQDEEETKLVRRLDDALISSTESVMGKLPQRSAQAAFDRLKDSRLGEGTSYKKLQKSNKVAGNLGRVEELQLDQLYPAKTEKRRRQSDSIAAELEAYARLRDVQSRIQQEQTVVPQAASAAPVELNETSGSAGLRIRTFESEIDPFEFSLLDSGHFVLYRKVWRDGQRYVQGLLIEQQAFLQGAVETQFRDTAIARMSNLIVAYQGEVFSAFSSTTSSSTSPIASVAELSGALLSQARMSAPFGDLELIFSINHLPVGPGASVIAWLSGILLLVLCGGFYLMYRLAGAQIDLTRQQQDFVSAVSHELKTPLTSIRMYGEILREGWASEEKKKSYYDYIHDESERLSRLIENVLQLARMTRNDLELDCQPANIAELIDIIRSRVASQVERAGFVLNLHCSTQVSPLNIHVDSDSLVQIIINLVDNAIKFSSNSEQRQIDIDCSLLSGNIAQFSVRDYGPGIDKDQMKRIFRLFYRTQNELTRETVGTGIGLALVQQLARLMNAKVDVVNKGPGAEFTISFAIV